MFENLEQVVKLFILLIDVIVVITLVATLIKGIKKGFFKYLITDGLKWILILILIMFSGEITKLLLNIDYPSIGKLGDYLINFLCTEFDLEYTAVAGSYTYDLIYGVVFATVRLILIYITALVVSILIYPIISLILRILGIRRLINNMSVKPLHRILGLVLSAVVFCVYFCITFFPYYGTMNIVSKVEADSQKISDNSDVQEVSFIENIQISDYIEASFIYPLFSKDNNIAVKYLNSIYVVKVKTEDLYLIDEYYVMDDALPILFKYVATLSKEENIVPTIEDIETITTVLKNSDSVEVLLPIVIEVAIAMDLFEQYELDITFEELHDINWHQEKKTLNEVFDDINNLYSVIYNHKDNLKEIFGTEEFVELTPELINDVFDLYLFNEYGYQILSIELDNYINNNSGSLADILELIEVKDLIEKDLIKICGVIRDLYQMGVFEKTEEGTNLTIVSEQQVENILTSIFNLSFIEGNEGTIFSMLMEFIGTFESGIEFELDVENPNINWESEIKNISHLIFVIYQNPNILGSLTNMDEEQKEIVVDILKTIVKLDLLNKTIPSLVANLIEEASMTEFKSDWLEEQCLNLNKEEWLIEVENLIDFINTLTNSDIDFSNIENIEITELHSFLHQAIKLKSITVDPVIELLNEELQGYFNNDKTYLTVSENINWEQEINLIFGEDKIYSQFKNLDENASFQNYGKLIDTMKVSSVFGPSIYEIIKDFIKASDLYKSSENPSGVLSSEDLKDDVFDTVLSWENELKLLDSIDLNSNMQTGETIDIIMHSTLLKGHIKDYILEIIVENNLSEYYLADNISQDIDKVNNYIDETKKDNDETNDYSWEKEVNTLADFSSKFADVKAGNMTEQSVKELKETAESSIITKSIFERILEEYPILNGYLN